MEKLSAARWKKKLFDLFYGSEKDLEDYFRLRKRLIERGVFDPKEFSRRRAEKLLQRAKEMGATVEHFLDIPMTTGAKMIVLPRKTLPSVAAHEAIEAIQMSKYPLLTPKSALDFLAAKGAKEKAKVVMSYLRNPAFWFEDRYKHANPGVFLRDLQAIPFLPEEEMRSLLAYRQKPKWIASELKIFERIGKPFKVTKKAIKGVYKQLTPLPSVKNILSGRKSNLPAARLAYPLRKAKALVGQRGSSIIEQLIEGLRKYRL